MEFQSSPQPTMDMNMNPSSEYEEIDEVKDDVFYAEIRRQILLLTADDDEDYQETSKPRSNRAVGNISSSLQYGSYFNPWESENTNSVPTWLANLWRKGNGSGTGVFIPHINKSRRRLRPGIYRQNFTTFWVNSPMVPNYAPNSILIPKL
ncbi:hypothetical protein PTKIN_Ptkin17bG0168700 [Pterospermum kingtungense]